jgi:hypothetical protein
VEGIPEVQGGMQLWAILSAGMNIWVTRKSSIFIYQLDGYQRFKKDSAYSDVWLVT